MKKQIILINFLILFQLAFGLYIKPIDQQQNNNNILKNNKPISESEWSIFKNKLGLTDNKVEILKTQKDQKATAELLRRFIRENPKYTIVNDESKTKSNSFNNVYKDMLKQLQITKGTLKASLNFELAENPQKHFKRSTRKIAVKMVSDIPSEKIDDLLQMFNEKHGLNNEESSDIIPEGSDDYNEIKTVPLPTDSDYIYEDLWEDEEAGATNSGPKLGSFQDLIMRASNQQWQRDMEERNFNNEHFV